MAVDEQRRHEMYRALEELVGPEVAATMMQHLPPVGWADVARRDDVEHLGATTRSELAAAVAILRAELADSAAGLGREIGEVRTEIAEVRTEIAEVRTDIAGVRTEIAESGRKTLMWVVSLFATFYVTLLASILTTR